MNTAVLIIDSLLLLGILCVSIYGASALPAGARVPIHFGPSLFNNWVPKNVALVMWPIGGVVAYVISIAVARNQQAQGGGSSAATIVPTVLLAVILVTHVVALRISLARGGQAP
jgi:hypothetical protein